MKQSQPQRALAQCFSRLILARTDSLAVRDVLPNERHSYSRMPRFNSQTLSAAETRAFVRARVPGADRAGSANLPLSDSAGLFAFGLRLRRAAR